MMESYSSSSIHHCRSQGFLICSKKSRKRSANFAPEILQKGEQSREMRAKPTKPTKSCGVTAVPLAYTAL
jgi:hypothetical protein